MAFDLWDPNASALSGVGQLLAAGRSRREQEPIRKEWEQWEEIQRLVAEKNASAAGRGGGWEASIGGEGPELAWRGETLSGNPYQSAAGYQPPAMQPGTATLPGGAPLPINMGGAGRSAMPVPLALGGEKMRGGGSMGDAQNAQGGGWLSGVGRFLSGNQELITGVLGTAADVYGAAKDRKQREKEFEATQAQREKERLMQEEENRKRREIDRIRMIIQGIGQFS